MLDIMSENPVKKVVRHAADPVADAAEAIKGTVAQVAADHHQHARIIDGVEESMAQRAREREPRNHR